MTYIDFINFPVMQKCSEKQPVSRADNGDIHKEVTGRCLTKWEIIS